MAKKPLTTEQRVVLPSVNWQQFEQLLLELGVERQTRLTYLRGKLELMTPVAAHERCSKLLDSLILVIADELGLPVTTLAPVLLKAPEIGCATEPDACYYFGASSVSPHTTQLDLTQDPVPHLLVEVALTKSPIEKLSIYATLGIPEVWRYETTAGDEMLKGQLTVYRLQNERYVEATTSAAFSWLPASRIVQFLEQSDSMSLATALRLLRAWIQEQLPRE